MTEETQGVNKPLRILQTLDRHLAASAEITLFGRATLALGAMPPHSRMLRCLPQGAPLFHR